MFHIRIAELFTHCLIQIRRIIRIICLRVFQLCQCFSKIRKLHFKRCIHLLQECIENFFYRIFLASGHRRNKCIQRIIHLLKSRSDDFFKAVCHLNGKLLCHLVHGCRLILLTCNQKIHGLCLCTRHHICMESVQEKLQILCQCRIFTLHTGCINDRKRNTIDRGKECNFNTIYQ